MSSTHGQAGHMSDEGEGEFQLKWDKWGDKGLQKHYSFQSESLESMLFDF